MSEEFNRILLDAIRTCDGQITENIAFTRGFSKLYPFTTENIAGYIDLFELKNKSLLTVGSSLDQTLNAILRDCKDITVLDINEYTKYYYFLKCAALQTLTRLEFLEYFRFKDYPKVFKDNKNVFKKESYYKLQGTLRLLDYESYLYWDELFQTNSPKKIRLNLFSQDEDRNSVIIGCNPYLQSDESYYQLRKKILSTKTKFITADIFNTDLSSYYDNIWLSNICTHINKKENIEDIRKLVALTANKLTSKGKLLISYLWDTTNNTKYQDDWQPIYDIETMRHLLKDYPFSLEEFQGIRALRFKEESYHDAVLIYQKK